MTNELPEPPGSVAVPDGHLRAVFSYVDAPHSDRSGEGFVVSGIPVSPSYGQVAAVAGHTPDVQGVAYVEFFVPLDDLDIGRGNSPETLYINRAHITVSRPIRKEEVVAVHLPWHACARRFLENKNPCPFTRNVS